MQKQKVAVAKEDTPTTIALFSLVFIVVAVISCAWLNEQMPSAKTVIKKEVVRIEKVAAKNPASKEAQYLAASRYQQE
jgi:hypothetical protein